MRQFSLIYLNFFQLLLFTTSFELIQRNPLIKYQSFTKEKKKKMTSSRIIAVLVLANAVSNNTAYYYCISWCCSTITSWKYNLLCRRNKFIIFFLNKAKRKRIGFNYTFTQRRGGGGALGRGSFALP